MPARPMSIVFGSMSVLSDSSDSPSDSTSDKAGQVESGGKDDRQKVELEPAKQLLEGARSVMWPDRVKVAR